jgi:FkbH-like protein
MDLANLERLKTVSKITACFIDLDGTLWSGILAEGQEPKIFVERLAALSELHRKGIQLFVVSKNDAKDVEDAFTRLKIKANDLFTWVAANWEPKYVNIDNLIRICAIRPETAVFVDDNPFELLEVKKQIPALNVLEASNLDFLLSVSAVADKKETSLADLEQRMNRYRSAITADSLKENYRGSDIEFYRRLKRTIGFGLVPADNLDRVTRLLVETHRLNFSPGKFVDSENAQEYIHSRVNAGDELYAITAAEGEFTLGLTGAIIVSYDAGSATITDGSFSCGIIGRDFEPKTLLILIDRLKKKGIKRLTIDFQLTATNVRLKEIVEGLGFSVAERTTDERGNLNLKYFLDISDYRTAGKYDWIAVSDEPPTFEYVGHPYVIRFFENRVKPLFVEGSKVLNLGSARGEVLGLLQNDVRESFYRFLDDKKIVYTKMDLEYYSDEKNVVANAEDLSSVVESGSQDIVMALELLEHAQRPQLIISEMTRICKSGGHIFISVPSFGYAKHEYPIDLWRFGPKTLQDIFSDHDYQVVALETEGQPSLPRRTMILVQKIGKKPLKVGLPRGKKDEKRGLTVFE